jgi:hypothetical protein
MGKGGPGPQNFSDYSVHKRKCFDKVEKVDKFNISLKFVKIYYFTL